MDDRFCGGMTAVLREGFELMVKMRWLKIISKEVDKYNSLNAKLKRQAYVVHALTRRYNELYPSDAIQTKEEDK